MDLLKVLVKPIVSEKSNDIREKDGKYAFKVVREANKSEIKQAVIKMWGVEVKSVRTLIKREKVRRRGKQISKPKTVKKAIVTLAAGGKLPLFDDQ